MLYTTEQTTASAALRIFPQGRSKLSEVANSKVLRRFPPALLTKTLAIFLNVALFTWGPSVHAQDSSREKADGAISGTVFSEGDKRPVSQVAISLISRAAGIFRSVLTDFAGHFEVRSLPRGAYEIKIEEDGYEPLQTSAKLEGPSSEVVVYLKSLQTIPGRRAAMVSVHELKIPWKAQEEYKKGLECLAKKETDKSLSYFRKAVQKFPEYYEAQYEAGVAEMRMGLYDNAKQTFQTAINVSGGRYAWADFGLGYLLYLEGKPGEAERIIRRGLDLDEYSSHGRVILGLTLLRLNRPDEAEKSAREALLRDPNSTQARLVLADVYGARQNYREQLVQLDAYLKLEPTGATSRHVQEVRERVVRILARSESQTAVAPVAEQLRPLQEQQ
jgi:tetratricopeptide (TPR) repeat protein